MIDITQAKPGDKVHYNRNGGVIENGIIKEIPEDQNEWVRVVYHCANQWENYMNYTSALTHKSYLHNDWIDDNTGN